ncbi:MULTISPECIES: hypothetical protein [Bacteroides]|uniref:hypothetical protein n=1 Tax=Bacteroides TaxID=816 RepID=UPI0018999541|nr:MULTISPECIES: hypothetical protein [Bacteroides]
MLTFGPKVTQTDFDYNIFQGQEPICAIRSQEMILRDFGIQIPKEELTAYATEQGWYHGNGTKPSDVGNLLETCNIGTHSQHCDSVYDLINELKDGHRVIVGVDAHELWAEPGSAEYEYYRNLTNADHALIVTSVNIDPLNPENSTVVLTDPGNGSIMEYDFEKFAHSWKDSKYFMMATDEAAPYQYDAENHCMQISNFATDFSVQEFPFHNEFTDIWQVDDLGYVPYYSNGHLLSITDDLSYDDFNYAFNSDSFETLDDSFNIDDIDDSWSHVEFTDNKIVTDIQPMDNLFDYSSESMIDDMSLSCDS